MLLPVPSHLSPPFLSLSGKRTGLQWLSRTFPPVLTALKPLFAALFLLWSHACSRRLSYFTVLCSFGSPVSAPRYSLGFFSCLLALVAKWTWGLVPPNCPLSTVPNQSALAMIKTTHGWYSRVMSGVEPRFPHQERMHRRESVCATPFVACYTALSR